MDSWCCECCTPASILGFWDRPESCPLFYQALYMLLPPSKVTYFIQEVRTVLPPALSSWHSLGFGCMWPFMGAFTLPVRPASSPLPGLNSNHTLVARLSLASPARLVYALFPRGLHATHHQKRHTLFYVFSSFVPRHTGRRSPWGHSFPSAFFAAVFHGPGTLWHVASIQWVYAEWMLNTHLPREDSSLFWLTVIALLGQALSNSWRLTPSFLEAGYPVLVHLQTYSPSLSKEYQVFEAGFEIFFISSSCGDIEPVVILYCCCWYWG